MSFSPRGNELCPRCGERVRSLRLSDEIVRHHQFLECGYRYENLHDPSEDHGQLESFECLKAFDEADRDGIETLIMLLLGSGTLDSALELTSRTLAGMVREHGAPFSTLRGFTFPACKWRIARTLRSASYLVVIDQGQWRVCFTMRRLYPTLT